MQPALGPREERAGFVRVVADGDHIIDGLLQIPIQGLRLLARDVYADLLHCPDGEGPYAGGLRARAHRLEAVAGKVPEQPSAICERAELWVQRNRTLDRSPDSAAVTDHAALLGTRDQAVGGLTEQPACGLPVEGVEAPLPSPLLLHQSRVLELLHVIGDLRLAHGEVLLKLTDADTLIPLRHGHVGVGEVAATAALGHHGEHPHPYGVGEGAAQGYESLHPSHSAALAGGVLLHDAELLGTHSVPSSAGLRPRMKALASGTSVEAAIATVVSPQQPEASANSSS